MLPIPEEEETLSSPFAAVNDIESDISVTDATVILGEDGQSFEGYHFDGMND